MSDQSRNRDLPPPPSFTFWERGLLGSGQTWVYTYLNLTPTLLERHWASRGMVFIWYFSRIYNSECYLIFTPFTRFPFVSQHVFVNWPPLTWLRSPSLYPRDSFTLGLWTSYSLTSVINRRVVVLGGKTILLDGNKFRNNFRRVNRR